MTAMADADASDGYPLLDPTSACRYAAGLDPVRERLRDKTNMWCRNLLPKLKPDERDRQFLPLPEFFSSLYYLVRPVRWTWEKVSER